MAHDTQGSADPLFAFLHRTVPWIVLAAMVGVVWVLASQYRGEVTSGKTSGESTATATSSVEATKPAGTKTTTVTPPSTPASGKTTGGIRVATTLVAGVHLRDAPAIDANTILSLAKGVELTILSQKPSWFQVKEPGGRTGWVKASESLLKVETK